MAQTNNPNHKRCPLASLLCFQHPHALGSCRRGKPTAGHGVPLAQAKTALHARKEASTLGEPGRVEDPPGESRWPAARSTALEWFAPIGRGASLAGTAPCCCPSTLFESTLLVLASSTVYAMPCGHARWRQGPTAGTLLFSALLSVLLLICPCGAARSIVYACRNGC